MIWGIEETLLTDKRKTTEHSYRQEKYNIAFFDDIIECAKMIDVLQRFNTNDTFLVINGKRKKVRLYTPFNKKLIIGKFKQEGQPFDLYAKDDKQKKALDGYSVFLNDYFSDETLNHMNPKENQTVLVINSIIDDANVHFIGNKNVNREFRKGDIVAISNKNQFEITGIEYQELINPNTGFVIGWKFKSAKGIEYILLNLDGFYIRDFQNDFIPIILDQIINIMNGHVFSTVKMVDAAKFTRKNLEKIFKSTREATLKNADIGMKTEMKNLTYYKDKIKTCTKNISKFKAIIETNPSDKDIDIEIDSLYKINRIDTIMATKRTITIYTKPILLKYYDMLISFGRFMISFETEKLKYQNIKIKSLDKTDEQIHPHVFPTYVCWGAHENEIGHLFMNGNLYFIIDGLMAFLHSYNSGDANYVPGLDFVILPNGKLFLSSDPTSYAITAPEYRDYCKYHKLDLIKNVAEAYKLGLGESYLENIGTEPEHPLTPDQREELKPEKKTTIKITPKK